MKNEIKRKLSTQAINTLKEIKKTAGRICVVEMIESKAEHNKKR